MSALSEIIESAFCDRVFKGEPDFWRLFIVCVIRVVL